MGKILGIDEVGRGPWAGPLIVGACVLREPIEGLTDSKKLSAKRRNLLAAEIREKAFCGLGWVFADELDRVGLSRALRLACRRAVEEIQAQRAPFSEIIIDGTINFLSGTRLSPYVQILPKADFLVEEVSAASIIAKVARDKYMAEVAAARFPDYGFEKHVGYGTKAHRKALEKFGVTAEHRKSFRPVAALCEETLKTQKTGGKTLSTTDRGGRGEDAVCAKLISIGHNIIARNWRTKYCEIDIVSTFEDVFYFTEVKYRKNKRNSEGMDAISPKKLQQMRFAAEFYLTKNATGKSARLLAASVSGDNYLVDEITEIS